MPNNYYAPPQIFRPSTIPGESILAHWYLIIIKLCTKLELEYHYETNETSQRMYLSRCTYYSSPKKQETKMPILIC